MGEGTPFSREQKGVPSPKKAPQAAPAGATGDLRHRQRGKGALPPKKISGFPKKI